MNRPRLSSNYQTANEDKWILERYRDHLISKSQAMSMIAKNNALPEISEEYFDYLFSLGYSYKEGE